MTIHESSLTVAAAHPALAGHFPGRPIVPGVVLLDHVMSFAEQCARRSLRTASLQQAKFMRPLLPAQEATLSVTLTDSELRFDIRYLGEPIAQGVFKLVPERSG